MKQVPRSESEPNLGEVVQPSRTTFIWVHYNKSEMDISKAIHSILTEQRPICMHGYIKFYSKICRNKATWYIMASIVGYCVKDMTSIKCWVKLRNESKQNNCPRCNYQTRKYLICACLENTQLYYFLFLPHDQGPILVWCLFWCLLLKMTNILEIYWIGTNTGLILNLLANPLFMLS
jgi:hypothetical protein